MEIIGLLNTILGILLSALAIVQQIEGIKAGGNSRDKRTSLTIIVVVGSIFIYLLYLIAKGYPSNVLIPPLPVLIILILFLISWIARDNFLDYWKLIWAVTIIIFKKKKLLVMFLFIFGLNLVYILSMKYASEVSATGYGPPIVFVSKISTQDSLTKDCQRLLNDTVYESFNVTFRKVGSHKSLFDGFLKIKKGTKTEGMISIIGHGDGLERDTFKISKISKLEFKKYIKSDSALGLWTIESLTDSSMIPHARLYILDTSDIQLYSNSELVERKCKGCKQSQKGLNQTIINCKPLKYKEITDIYLPNALDMNGIDVYALDGNYYIRLMGYNGQLHNCLIKSKVDVKFLKRCAKQASTQSIELLSSFNLTYLLNKKDSSRISWPTIGWQNIDSYSNIPGKIEGLPFISINAITERVVIYNLSWNKVTGKDIKLLIDTTFPIPTKREIRLDQGCTTFEYKEDGRQKEYYLVTTDAYSGLINLYLSYDRVFRKFDSVPASLQLSNVYVEGAAVSSNKHHDLFISGRNGIIYYRPCYKCESKGILSSVCCFFRTLVPDRISLRENWFYELDMKPFVTHLQDISCAEDGGIWYLDQSYFRRLYPELFNWRYQWSVFISYNEGRFLNTILLFYLILFFLGYRIYRKKRKFLEIQDDQRSIHPI
ncbi:MAG: hypothetical protein NT040_19255 [Bacteroidetes bacterium]|nr:hypothetical protein [Bacteroidota bacterium]